MADPVIVVSPAPIADGQNVTVDTSAFNNKLAATDNLLQEIADALDDHTHAATEITVGTYTGILTDATDAGDALDKLDAHTHAYADITDNTHSHNLSDLTDFVAPNDNLTDLGAADARWKDIYAGNAVIQTSDRSYKTDIKMMETRDCWSFVQSLSPVTFKFKGGKRTHTGFIAQEVRDALARSQKDFAIFVDQGGVCGLRYDEAIAPIVGCLLDLADSVRGLGRDIEHFNNVQDAVARDTKTFVSILEGDTEDRVPRAEHRATIDALVSRISELENKKEVKPADWVAWAAIGISIIAGLCHFL